MLGIQVIGKLRVRAVLPGPMLWPVPDGLADHPDYLRYISLAEKTAAPWFKLSVFGELRSSNGGLLAAGENRKVFSPHLAN